MKKIGIALVLLAMIWGIPPLRAGVSRGAVPVLEKLGPAGSSLLTPARRFAAKGKVTHILRLIAVDYNEGREVPDERNFRRWLQRRLGDDALLDPWGGPYWMQRGRGTMTVGSSGPDGRRGTADDVKHTVPF